VPSVRGANKYVFKCLLKVDSDDDDVTNDGKPFQLLCSSSIQFLIYKDLDKDQRPIQSIHYHGTGCLELSVSVIKSSATIATFKTHLKTELFAAA